MTLMPLKHLGSRGCREIIYYYMNLFRNLLTFLLIAFLSVSTLGQSNEQDFENELQTYYLKKDKKIVEITIDFLNNSTLEHTRLEPLLTGFFGALFSSNYRIKKNFLLT